MKLTKSAVAEFQGRVISVVRGPNTVQAQAVLRYGMQEGELSLLYGLTLADQIALVTRSLSQHPGVGPVWTEACERILSNAAPGRDHATIGDVELARRIPLPPSPPSSPLLGPRRL